MTAYAHDQGPSHTSSVVVRHLPQDVTLPLAEHQSLQAGETFSFSSKILVAKHLVVGQFGTGQFGTRTIWHQDNLAPDNLAPGQFGTNIIKTDNLAPDNLAPGQFGTNIIKRTIWHQKKNGIQIIV